MAGEWLAWTSIRKMFDSIILEPDYTCNYTTIYHFDCGHTFGGAWKKKYHSYSGYSTESKYYNCPECGTHSNPWKDKIHISRNPDEIYPISMEIKVINYKNFLDLRVDYRGIQLFTDGTRSKERGYTEQLRFDFKKKSAFLIDRNRMHHKITPRYFNEAESVLPVLKYIGTSYAVCGNRKTELNKIFKTLRLTFECRLKETYGFSVKKIYIPPKICEYGGYHNTMLANMALKISAPDMPPITEISKSTKWWSGDRSYRKIVVNIDDTVLDETKKGVGFIDALIKSFNAPNSKALRKAMATDVMVVTTANILNLFNDENVRRRLLSHNTKETGYYRITTRTICESMRVENQLIRDMWLQLIKRHGESTILNYLLSNDRHDIRDVSIMYEKLNKEYRKSVWDRKCKLKEFHDLIVKIYNQQEYGDVNLPAIPALNKDVNGMHFIVPKTAADLMTVGKQLKNCVGSYKDRVLRGYTAIVVVTNENMKPIACLELERCDGTFSKLVQAKLFANKRVAKDECINATVLKWADQLKITPTTIDVTARAS
ncbi:PcfJ domain-containing protein [Veillonella montpellierensis]|uniref:PcfJ domain-containing protein n=1 Tax=Veillonella montpellierensis TaxID=187328 RepID=UPI00040F6C65|nr:PcfJ domain-containing protein [Veillonella montpellierensis]